MRAIQFTKYGTPDVLRAAQIEEPIPLDDEILIKVYASSINSWDWELLQGIPFINRLVFGLLKPKKINVLGCDIAGRVEKVGRRVTRFKPGDEVLGDLSGGAWGGFAEYTCANEKYLTLKPAGISFAEAAAIPQAGVLAWQGLRQGQLQSGQEVLINGASGGVGTFAVQLAKSLGTQVTGVCSGKKMDLVRSLGADHVIDYTQQDFTLATQTYDFILDVQGHHSVFDYQRVLKPNGVYTMVGGSMWLVLQIMLLGPLISMTRGKRMRLLLHKPNAEDLRTMMALVKNGKIATVIDKQYPVAAVADAFRYFGEGRAKGKVVITL